MFFCKYMYFNNGLFDEIINIKINRYNICIIYIIFNSVILTGLSQVAKLKGLWRGGHCKLNWPNFLIPHVFLRLVTNFQLCFFNSYRENTSLFFTAEIGIPTCSWCHTFEIMGGCDDNSYERVSGGKLLLLTEM